MLNHGISEREVFTVNWSYSVLDVFFTVGSEVFIFLHRWITNPTLTMLFRYSQELGPKLHHIQRRPFIICLNIIQLQMCISLSHLPCIQCKLLMNLLLCHYRYSFFRIIIISIHLTLKQVHSEIYRVQLFIGGWRWTLTILGYFNWEGRVICFV